jgi:hypothetical protein
LSQPIRGTGNGGETKTKQWFNFSALKKEKDAARKVP